MGVAPGDAESFTKQRVALRYWLLGRDWTLALEALGLAERHHTGTRKDGVTPELSHQVMVAHYLRTLHASLLYPEETLAVALLHDVREDYDLSDEEVRRVCGDQVADAVDAMTKTFRGTDRDPAAVFAMIAEDPIASITKAADRIHNQHSAIGVFSTEKIRSYIEETERWFLPMLREARVRFPSQEPVYENTKFVLRSQLAMLRALVDEDA